MEVVGNILGSSIQADAAESAAATQAAASDRANARLQQQYDTTRADLAPYRDYGTTALSALAQKLGLGGDPAAGDYGSLSKTFTGSDLSSDPGYKFGLDEGLKALDRRALAGGGYFSGAAMKGLNRYAQDYAGTKFGEAFNRDQAAKTQTYNFLSGGAGLGQNAAAMTGNAGTALASQQANNTTAQGNAAAAAQIAAGQGWANGINSGIGAYQSNRLMDRILSGNKGWGGNSLGASTSQPMFLNEE